MKKILAFVISLVMVMGMVVPVSAHWVDNWVPMEIQSALTSVDGTAGNDVEITRLQFCKNLLKLYEIVNGRPMERGGLYVVPFSDCNDQAPYILATQGIVSGMSEGIFAPNSTLTRAQCVAMVKRAMAPTRSGNGSFPDTTSHWASPEIAWATENGITHGFDDGYFHPDWNLTVAQARKILYTAQKQFGWVGVTSFSGGNGTGNNYYGNGGSFSPTPQQGQGYTNPDGTWNNNGYYDNGYNNGYNNGYYDNSYNNGYNNGYYDNSYNNGYNNGYYDNGFGQTPGYNNNNYYNGGSFSDTPANGGVAGDYTPSAPTNGGGF